MQYSTIYVRAIFLPLCPCGMGKLCVYMYMTPGGSSASHIYTHNTVKMSLVYWCHAECRGKLEVLREKPVSVSQ
jgi:hypothetical protein